MRRFATALLTFVIFSQTASAISLTRRQLFGFLGTATCAALFKPLDGKDLEDLRRGIAASYRQKGVALSDTTLGAKDPQLAGFWNLVQEELKTRTAETGEFEVPFTYDIPGGPSFAERFLVRYAGWVDAEYDGKVVRERQVVAFKLVKEKETAAPEAPRS